MVDPADALATVLAAAGLSLTRGTNLFVGQMPPAGLAIDGVTVAGKCVSVLATGGSSPQGFVGQGKKAVLYPRCQITVRGDVEAYQAGQTLAFGVFEALNQTTTGTFFAIQVRESAPAYMGQDSARRDRWVLNVDLAYVNSPA
jgi:hypothetical protein